MTAGTLTSTLFMISRPLERLLSLLVLTSFSTIIAGAIRTSGSPSTRLPHADPHLALAVVTFLAALIALPWAARRGMKILSACAALTFIGQIGAGVAGLFGPLPAPLAILHANLAPVLFSLFLTMMIVSTPAYASGPVPADDTSSPSLRVLSLYSVGIVLLQMILGSVYRHQIGPVWPHIAGSFVASGVLLLAAMCVYDNHPHHTRLKNYAHLLLSVALLQIGLGLAAYTMRVIGGDTSSAAMIGATVAHVAMGAVILALALCFAVETHYHLRPSPSSVAQEVTA